MRVKTRKTSQVPVQRQRRERGQQRVDSLLASAEQVFADIGYEQATTNLIAERAAASPGTLYQFFRNKEMIAESLANRYAARLSEIQGGIMQEIEGLTQHEQIDCVAETYIRFLQAAPAFGALMESVAISRGISEIRKILLDSAIHWIAKVIAEIAPGLAKSEQKIHASVCVMVFRGMIPMLQAKSASERKRATVELKNVIHRYLAPVLDQGSQPV